MMNKGTAWRGLTYVYDAINGVREGVPKEFPLPAPSRLLLGAGQRGVGARLKKQGVLFVGERVRHDQI